MQDLQDLISFSDIELTPNKEAIKQLFKREIEKRIGSSINIQLREFFDDNHVYRNGGVVKKVSPANTAIKEAVTNYFASEECQAFMNKYIKDNFQTIFEQELQKAISHKTRSFVYNTKELEAIRQAAKKLRETNHTA